MNKESATNSMLKKIVVKFYFPAIENGDMTKVKLFIEERVNIDVTDSNGMTALIYAALNGRLNIVKYLVSHGADVNAKDNKGETALMGAASRGDSDIVKYLVSHGADVNTKNNKGGTALMWVAFRGDLDIVKYLVSHGVDVNAIDSNGRTALDLVNQSEKNKTAIFLKDAMLKLIKKEIVRLKKEIADPKVQNIKFKPLTELHRGNSDFGR